MERLKNGYRRDFLAIVDKRDFVTFEELSKKLGITTSELIALKGEFEEELRREDDKIRLTARHDMDPPCFEIES